eukprot:1009729-Prymnesium_polylepis.1
MKRRRLERMHRARARVLAVAPHALVHRHGRARESVRADAVRLAAAEHVDVDPAQGAAARWQPERRHG